MPTRRKRDGPTARTYETVERPKQARFTPRNRTVTPRTVSLSTPRTRQQTLTQIQFVSRYTSDHEGVDLNYVEDEVPRARKRRKTMAEAQPARNVETRATKANTKRRESTAEGMEEILPAQLDEDPTQSSQPPSDSAPFSMPPFRTPKKIRKTEIPSSQSPADSPFSTRSIISARSNSRSPLKHRSTNFLISRPSPPGTRKDVGLTPKLEVEDTYEYENEDSSRSTRSRSSRLRSTEEYVAAGASFLRLLDRPEHFEGNTPEVEDSDVLNREIPDTETTVAALFPAAERHSIKSDVADSSDEGDHMGEEHENMGDENDFKPGNDTQAALCAFGILSSQTRNQRQLESTELQEHTKISLAVNENPTGIASRRHDKVNNEIPQHHHGETVVPSERSGRTISSLLFQHNSAPSSQSHTPPTISIPQGPLFPKTESQEASNQLTSDLIRHTQPHLVLETESQFQCAWRDYSPPKDYNDDDERNHEEQPEQHLPHISSDAISADLPPQVRPSQATTVDVTESSPHIARTQASPLRFRKKPRQLGSQLRPPEETHSSSPPPTATLSSSPVKDVELVWNGERLTDSQLLPDSLMNDSLPAPPPLTQESLDEGY
ncbi:MAG: hypothetical protein FRX48_03190 [Lasallia pustulata]|uniref:Uncharacterized protein n=1 Tax=Lasallia pustulata TaxID=136370 RepID=A0A5M8PWL0_9LECA|nr:MAG: hypothetical protein FRX48_03190 [Lasallia pustulata]